MSDPKTMTPEALTARQKLLESEIDANEEEARMYQEELNQVYAEQDRRKSS